MEVIYRADSSVPAGCGAWLYRSVRVSLHEARLLQDTLHWKLCSLLVPGIPVVALTADEWGVWGEYRQSLFSLN